MSWFKVDDKLHDHRKARKARRSLERPRDAAAIGVWVLAGSWCMANRTDGFVPEDELDGWDTNGKALALRLVDAGLWAPAHQDGEDGYQFHEWTEWQESVAYQDEKRRRAAERMRRAREQGGDVRANTERTSDEVTPTPTQPNPTKQKTPAAARASADFDAFWKLYPRKVGREAAARRFATVVKRTDVATIAAGLHRAIAQWQADGTEPQFIPHPATWLNQGRWADEVTDTKADPAAHQLELASLPPLPVPPDEVTEAGGAAIAEWAKGVRAEQRKAGQHLGRCNREHSPTEPCR